VRFSRLASFVLPMALALAACSPPVSSSSARAVTAQVGVVVLDSVNGAPVPWATVNVLDARSSVVHTDTTTAQGTLAPFSLTEGTPYSLTAYAPGRAASTLQGYLAGSGTVALYCPAPANGGVAATAPTVRSIEVSGDGVSWVPLMNGATLAPGFQARVAVFGAAEVEAASGSGIAVGIDEMPAQNTGWSAPSPLVTILADSNFDPASSQYQSVAQFDLSKLDLPAGNHTVIVVAHDVTLNRVEQRVAFTVK